jgi:hypothetical protein
MYSVRGSRIMPLAIFACPGLQVASLQRVAEMQTARREGRAVCIEGCLTMTYFRTGNPYYHRRAAVSRSCSGWEGVVPAGYGRQALAGVRSQKTEASKSCPRHAGV